MHDYHVVLTDGNERNIKAGTAVVTPHGALVFRSNETPVADTGATTYVDLVVAYAQGEWKYVEVERKDDKG